MSWRIEFNFDHVRVVRRLLWEWVWYILFLVVIGWGYGPRLDEVAFVMFVVPLCVLVPYIALCFALAVLKSLWPQRWQDSPPPPPRVMT
jgi:hypothetical protein